MLSTVQARARTAQPKTTAAPSYSRPALSSIPHNPDLDPFLPTGGGKLTKGQELASRYMAPFQNELNPALAFGGAALTKTLSDPYNIPASIKTKMLKDTTAASQAAINRMRGAGVASGNITGGQRSGVGAALMGNAEMARAEAINDVEVAYADMATKIGDDRIARMYLPLLNQMSESYDRSMGYALSPKAKQKKRDWLKTIGGALVATVGGYFTGGLLTPVGGAIMEAGAPRTEETYDY